MTTNRFDDNTPLWAALLNAVASAPDAYGVVSGTAPSTGTGDWDVDVASGTVHIDGSDVSVSGQTVDLSDPTSDMSSGETKVVLVHVNDSGTASATEGSSATDPVSPDIPSGEVLVALVQVAAADGTIADSDLFDARVDLVPPTPTRDVLAYDLVMP